MALALELEAFHYPGEPTLFAPVGLSLAVGESVALVGPSGSGKSSLVTLLAGLHPEPLGGRLRGRVDYGVASAAGAQSPPGYLGSDPEAFLTGFCSTVMEEVGWSLFGEGWSPDQVQERVEQVGEELSLSHLLWRDPRRLSGGQQQLVALAAVWARRPRLLLLDEPVCKLDPLARERLQEAVQRLARAGLAGVLWSTSNLAEVTWCDRVWVLEGPAPVRILNHPASDWSPGPELVPPWPLEWSRRWGIKEIPWTSSALPRDGRPPQGLDPAKPSESDVLALQASSLRYRPPGRDSDLFTELNWSVKRGECVGLVGVNGAGKTTLARLIRGLDRPCEGKIVVEGKEVGKEPPSRLTSVVAYTFQEPGNLFVRSRVDGELRFSGELLGLSQQQAELRSQEALHLFGLNDYAAIHPRELPASAAALLGVALSWYTGARVQILDEPLARLDQPGRLVLEEVIAKWRQAGVTVVVIAHDLDWVCSICSSIAVLGAGGILAQGPPLEIFTRPEVVASLGSPVFLGADNQDLRADF